MSKRAKGAWRRIGLITGEILLGLLIWIGSAALIAGLGIRYFWGEITFEQMRMNLVSVQFDGGGGPIVWMGLLFVVILPVLLALSVLLWRWRRRKKRNRLEERRRRLPWAENLRTARWPQRVASITLVMLLVLGGGALFVNTVGIREYLRAASLDYTIEDYYVPPEVTSAENPRNLILIYLESGEQTLANDVDFEKNAFAPLEAVTTPEQGWMSVRDFQQYAGGGWTMSGLVSTQCGIPLKGGSGLSSGAEPAEPGEDMSYLGGVTCMGDVLQKQGYQSVFLGGANSSFASKNQFLTSHGYSTVKDLFTWRELGEPEQNFRPDWGLSDQRLMAHAKDEVDRLHAEYEQTGQPFNLTMLTLDTHEPVHVYDYCTVDTENEVTSVYECSMAQVADYVTYLQQQGYLKDTAVAIMGDHLKHMSAGDAFHEQLDHHPNRTIFNRFWVPGEAADDLTMRPEVDQLSMYPTLLEAAGLQIRDRQAGLGVSAFARKIPEGSAQALPPEEYRALLKAHSTDFYSSAWK